MHGLSRPVNALARHAAGLIRSSVRAFGSVGRLSILACSLTPVLSSLVRLLAVGALRLGGLPGAFSDLTRSPAGSLPGFLSGLTRTLADLPGSLAGALPNVSNATTDIFGSFARALDGLARAFADILDR